MSENKGCTLDLSPDTRLTPEWEAKLRTIQSFKPKLVNFQIDPGLYSAWKEQTDSLGLKYGDRLRAHIEADVRTTETEHRVLALLAEVKGTLERINTMLTEDK